VTIAHMLQMSCDGIALHRDAYIINSRSEQHEKHQQFTIVNHPLIQPVAWAAKNLRTFWAVLHGH